MDREQILAALEAAAGQVEYAGGALAAVEAYEWVTRQPGLWYAPISAAGGNVLFVVGCNGAVIGTMRSSGAGTVLGGWSAVTLDGTPVTAAVDGQMRTPRACAAALARQVGVTPQHPS